MEEQYYADRASLRRLLTDHPYWTKRQYAEATGRSLRWVKKWLKRLQTAPPDDDTVLYGLSRAPHHPPPRIAEPVVRRILEIRDNPPDNLQRIPGPKAILYYLHQDEALKQSGHPIPTSTRTIWRILDEHGRIYRQQRPAHEPVERPAPLSSWQIDFKDVSSVPPDPAGKQQHGVETFNVVDVGTSMVLDAVVRPDFAGDTAIMAATNTLMQQGVPQQVTYDRDPRFVGSWTGKDFPAPFTRFWLSLGVAVNICPPRRPNKNAFVERYHRSYEYECLQIHRPGDCQAADEVTQAYRTHYNRERPNQAITCGNRPPAQAFPNLPTLPALPQQIDPDGWLRSIHGQRYVRKINANGSVKIDNRSYYVKRVLRHHYVTVKVDAQQRQLVIEHNQQVIKTVPIKGLYDRTVNFEVYLELIQAEAKVHWQRVMRQRQYRKIGVA